MSSGRPSGIISTVGVPGAPLMYGSSQVRFSVAPSPSVQQFVPAPVGYYPSHISAVSNSVPLVGGGPAAGLQRVYVPVQQMPLHPYTSIPAGQLPVTDPSKLLEEQKKFEKERNFQWQQQRLKQFTVAGKKGSLNADSLLDSMFGKPDSKKGNAKPLPNEKIIDSTANQVAVANMSEPNKFPSLPQQQSMEKWPVEKTVLSSGNDPKGKSEADPKKLENMMLQCSSLSGPQKAKGFQKPLVKEISRMPQNTKTFSSSRKAVNWTYIQGLENVFSQPQPRFPVWCKKETVPLLYRQVEKIVTNDGNHAPDTNLLFPILLSSGLSQKSLGEIWELANITTPGQLANEEMYAALALIAIVQAGHHVTDISILHRLPSCPVPILQCFQPPPPSSPPESFSTPPASTPNAAVADTDQSSASTSDEAETGNTQSSNVSRPAYIPLVKHSNASNVPKPKSSWSPFGASGDETPVPDDDFDEFKSATPVAINAPPMTISSSSTTSQTPEDDFGDFKQADSSINAPLPKLQLTKPKTVKGSVVPDLLLPDDDKYSVFRTLQLSGIPTSAKTDEVNSCVLTSSTLNENSKNFKTNSEAKPKSISIDKTGADDDDEFGDFLDACAVPAPVTSAPQLQSTIKLNTFIQNFADFTKLTESPSQNENCSLLTSKPSAVKNASDEDAEFGDFAAFQTSKTEMGQDYFFPCNKDNISLTETQSISSLELGTFDGTLQLGAFDGILHTGDAKSSLSRQGSIPSLDLRCASVEGVDIDDGFGELRSAITRSSKSPTPSLDTNKSSGERSPSNSISGLSFPSVPIVPLTDKYSVIRSEQFKYEDQHLSNWTRCIEGCLMILQKATRIFNQMSCSSVCHEVLSTEEGKNYVKNVIEVYRIVCRVNLASKSYEKQNNKLQGLITDCDKAFHTLSTFLAGSALLPEDSSLDFSLGLLRSNHDSNEKACGVCLLNVDSRSKAFNKNEDINKLIYGSRQYHSACANLWVNYVDPLLPVLTLPQLI